MMNSFNLADRLLTTITDAYEMGYDSVYLTPNYLGYRGIDESKALDAANSLIDKEAASRIEVEPDRTIVIRIKENPLNIAS